MRSYDTSRTIFGIVEFLAWASLILGGLFFVIGLNGVFSRSGFGGNLSAILIVPGVILVVFALLAIVTIQTARAGVDTAELTGQMLKVARDQLEVSRHALRQGEAIRASFESLKVAEVAPTVPGGFDTHDFSAPKRPVAETVPAVAVVAVEAVVQPKTETAIPAAAPVEAVLPTVEEVPRIEMAPEPAVTFEIAETGPADPVETEPLPVIAEPEPEPLPVDTGPRVFSHRGQTIVRNGTDYHVLGQTFADLGAARARVDHLIEERARQRSS